MDKALIERLAGLRGIGDAYHNYRGEIKHFSLETKAGILKAMGYPLAVDLLYGGEEIKLSEFKRKFKLGKEQEERPLIGRLTLHAHRLTFAHPLTGVELTLESPMPKDFRATLEALHKWAARA